MREFAHVCFKHARNLRMSGLRSYYVFLCFNKTAVLFKNTKIGVLLMASAGNLEILIGHRRG